MTPEQGQQFTRLLETWAVEGGIARIRVLGREPSSLTADEKNRFAEAGVRILKERIPAMLEDMRRAADPFGFGKIAPMGTQWASFSVKADAMLAGADALDEAVRP